LKYSDVLLKKIEYQFIGDIHMNEEQQPIAVDKAYKIRDNQLWYNDCAFADIVRNRSSIVVNIEGLGLRSLNHSEKGKDERSTSSYKLQSSSDGTWWEAHRGEFVQLELMSIEE
jgi:hypothetical protein